MKTTKIISLIMVLTMLLSAFSIVGVTAAEAEPAELKFSGATLSIDSDITVYFMVAEEALAGYEAFYATFEVSGRTATTGSYFEHTYAGKNYYMIPCYEVAAKEINDEITANIYGVNGGVATKGEELVYSVAKYCYNKLESAASGENMKKLAANLLTYGAAAQTEFNYNTEALATDNMTDAHRAYVTAVDVNALTSHYENIALEGATVTVSGATMELANRISVVFVLEGATDGTTAKLTWDGGEQTVSSADYKTIEGKKYVYFDGVDPADYGKVLTVTVYNGENAVSNTVKYSLETYAKNKGSAVALSVLGYCKSAETYIGGNKCLNGHTWTEVAGGDENYNLIEKCAVCGGERQSDAKVIAFTSAEAISSFTYGQTVTFDKGYDATANALKIKLPFAHNDPYILIKTGSAVDLSEYSYIAVYAKSNADFSMGYQGDANQNLNHFEASVEWKSYVMNCSALTGSFGTARINFKEKEKDDLIYINSIAFFKTEAEAKAFKGIDPKENCYFGHTEQYEANVDASNNLTMSVACSVCGNTVNGSGKVVTALDLWKAKNTSGAYAQACNFSATCNDNVYEQKVVSCSSLSSCYSEVYPNKIGISFQIDDYKYMVVRYKSDCGVKVRYKTSNNNSWTAIDAAASGDWTSSVMAINYTGNLKGLRIDFLDTTSGKTLYIDSIAFFATAEEANAFAGVYH